MPRAHDKSFKELILETATRIPDRYLSQLLFDTYGRYEYHSSVARKNHIFFRNFHYFLSFAIPIYSAFFTYIVSNELIRSGTILGAIGLVLTMLTIILSILKPYERCISAGSILIRLSDWKTDLILGLGSIEPESEPSQKALLFELLKRKDREISEIGEAMMENLIPKSSANIQESPTPKIANQ